MLLALFAICACAFPARSLASDRLIVGFDDDATAPERVDALQDAGVAIDTTKQLAAREIDPIDVAIVTVGEGHGGAIASELRADPDVRYVEPDHVAHMLAVPNDPLFPEQWGMLKIGAATAWDTTDGTGAIVAIVDTGVAYDHTDLAGKVINGPDYVDHDSDPMDVNGHGTHVAGIAAGIANNDFGIAGVAPGAQILAVRVLDADGAGLYSDIVRGIMYSADHGAKAINISLGGTDASTALEEAVNYATARGAVVACATGNESAKQLGYPARYSSCLAVGATTSSDTKASFSNSGPGIDVAAPGEGILSSVQEGGHDSWDGTSMATPFVTGLAGLLSTRGLGRRQIESIIKSTAVDLGPSGYDTTFGYGRIDASAAIAAAPVPDPAAPVDGTLPVVGDPAAGNLGFRVGPRYNRFVKRVVVKWVTSTSPWHRIASGGLPSGLTWSEVERGTGWQRTYQYRVRGTAIEQRVVVKRKRRTTVRIKIVYRDVVVSARDDVAVDRVGVAVNGHWIGTDYDGSDGWKIRWRCRVGGHRMVVKAFDAADNMGRSSGAVRVRAC